MNVIGLIYTCVCSELWFYTPEGVRSQVEAAFLPREDATGRLVPGVFTLLLLQFVSTVSIVAANTSVAVLR